MRFLNAHFSVSFCVSALFFMNSFFSVKKFVQNQKVGLDVNSGFLKPRCNIISPLNE